MLQRVLDEHTGAERMIHQRKLKLLSTTLLLTLLTGCSRGPAKVKIPKYDAQRAAQQAVEEMDTDGDQLLSREELVPSAGLLAALASIDQSGDQQLSADEIEQRVAMYAAMKMGAQSVTCVVTMGGRPLVGAEVSFVPEPFLTETIKSGKGKTRADGSASLVTEDRVPGLSPGLYRVSISKIENGQETIPVQYNTSTELGHEVSSDAAYAKFDLN